MELTNKKEGFLYLPLFFFSRVLVLDLPFPGLKSEASEYPPRHLEHQILRSGWKYPRLFH